MYTALNMSEPAFFDQEHRYRGTKLGLIAFVDTVHRYREIELGF